MIQRLLHLLEKHLYGWRLFVLAFLVRYLFLWVSGYDHYELNTDSIWINRLAEQTVKGNFNYDIGRFIVAPFYQVFSAAHKILFGEYWAIALTFTQVILSSLSVLALYRTGNHLFSRTTAATGAFVYALFPLTLWWVGTFSSESLFQSLLIFSLSGLTAYIRTGEWRDLLLSSCAFSLAFLTKSHLLLFAPFIILYLWMNRRTFKSFLSGSILYTSVSLAATLPFGIYNMQRHGVYVLSSNGGPFHFYTGNSTFGYRAIVDVPKIGSEGFQALHELDFAYYNGPVHDSIMAFPHREKQGMYLKESLRWIREHTGDFFQLKAYDLGFFLLPGVSFRHYPLKVWLFVIILSLPLYALAYRMMYLIIRHRRKEHYFLIYLFLTMMLFSVVFYVQNRFRTITLEPVFILYAAAWIVYKIRGSDNPFSRDDSLHLGEW